ncbi:MFS transporter [Saccharopolyspora sp. HNM0983]|uniref:MFS transporter n=1 Tax=Saccharopolyspora montiporae TaxID=2781240 RepID=A0A929B7C8_9PSEU|nr:MFS transporter [Saccharopolyspora sp. HNM0983]MBE9372943.1 MFS transporter [Saccharopolyspora sp. HNM0983]
MAPPDSTDPSQISGSGLPATRSTAYYAGVLAVLILVVEITGLTFTMVTPALTDISATFGTTEIGWLMTATTLVGAIGYPLFGKIGDIAGKKKVLLAVTLVAAAGSALAAAAPSLGALIAGRALQGFGICALTMVYGLIRDLFPARTVPVALGFVGAGFGVSPIIGPLLSGALIGGAGFAGVFWFLAGYGVLTAVLVQLAVPETPLRNRVRLDWLGIVLLGAGACAALLAIGRAGTAGWRDPLTASGLVGGLLLFALFVLHERYPAEPLIDTRLLADRRVAATLLTSFVVQAGLAGSNMLVPLFVMAPPEAGYGFGVDALGAAQYLVIGGIAGALAGPLAGLVSRRIGPRTVLTAGVCCLVTGALLLATVNDTTGQLMVAKFVAGIGIGTCSAALPNMIVAAVPAHAQGISGGMMNLSGALGSSFSTQLMAVILLVPPTLQIGGREVYAEAGFRYGFAVLAGLGLLGVLAMLTSLRTARPGTLTR